MRPNLVYRISSLDREFCASGSNAEHRAWTRKHRRRLVLCGLFPVFSAVRSPKFERCAATYWSASTKIASSCVRNSDLSYAKCPMVSTAGRRDESWDEQEIHPCRFCLPGIAPGDHRTG